MFYTRYMVKEVFVLMADPFIKTLRGKFEESEEYMH